MSFNPKKGMRYLAQKGESCRSMFDCQGVMDCCMGIGSYSEPNLCYP